MSGILDENLALNHDAQWFDPVAKVKGSDASFLFGLMMIEISFFSIT